MVVTGGGHYENIYMNLRLGSLLYLGLKIPGARFTKYLTIYHTIVLSLS